MFSAFKKTALRSLPYICVNMREEQVLVSQQGNSTCLFIEFNSLLLFSYSCLCCTIYIAGCFFLSNETVKLFLLYLFTIGGLILFFLDDWKGGRNIPFKTIHAVCKNMAADLFQINCRLTAEILFGIFQGSHFLQFNKAKPCIKSCYVPHCSLWDIVLEPLSLQIDPVFELDFISPASLTVLNLAPFCSKIPIDGPIERDLFT